MLHYCNQELQIENLTYDMKNVLTWFKIESITANPKKIDCGGITRIDHRQQTEFGKHFKITAYGVIKPLYIRAN